MNAKSLNVLSLTSLFVNIHRKNGTVLGPATCFVMLAIPSRKAVLITNRHVVTYVPKDLKETPPADSYLPGSLQVFFHRGQPADANNFGIVGNWVPVEIPLYKEDGKPAWIEHPVYGSDMDVVALPFDDPGFRTGRIKVALFDDPDPNIIYEPADPVSVIGFPFGDLGSGHWPIWVNGYVASEPALSAWKGFPVLLIDCLGRPGLSGAPAVFSRRNAIVRRHGSSIAGLEPGFTYRFLGVYSGRVEETGRLNRDSTIGMVWKAEAVQELLASVP